jgi:photosystem II stability/assembly factor-like uncharacterized protein
MAFCLNSCVFGCLLGQSWSLVNDYIPEVLWDVAFASASIGITVGQQGQVFRTVDGGASWSFYDLGTNEILRTAYFADVKHGFILGNAMYQTTNSGASWVISAGPGLPMESIYFVDNQHGTVVGANGSIFHTTNGGSSWIVQTSNASNTLKGVWFTSENNGIIVGEAGIILRTSDGGSSWNHSLSGTLQDLNSIYFLNGSTGFIAGGNGTILRTTDGGLSWLPSQVEFTVVSLLKVRMLDASNGFAFGNSSNPAAPIEFFRTTDGGLTWSRQSYGKNRAVQFYGMAVIDPKRCIVVGSFGTVMRTTDGGSTWQSQELLPDVDLVGVTAPFSGILTRSFVAPSSAGFTFESSNGATWVLNRYTGRALRAIDGAGASLNMSTSIMAGDAGTVVVADANQRIGTTAIVQLRSDLELKSVFMQDRDTAYIVADSGYLYKSTNRGRSWTPASTGGDVQINGIGFTDAMNGFAVGEAGWIKRSTDFGRSWVNAFRITPATLNAIAFASPYVGIIAGEHGTILRTSNGGLFWAILPSPIRADLHAVAFATPDLALAVGDSGRIIGSRDGGRSWQIQESPVTTNLRGVAFLDETVAVAVGEKRTIVRTTSGVTSVEGDKGKKIPNGFALEQNYPNPFNPKTDVRYQVGQTLGPAGGRPGVAAVSEVKITVYDVLGREVAVLVNERKLPGRYEVTFDGSHLASGVYFYRMQAGNFVQTRKLTLLK